jgi:hypothetical protein
LLVFRSQEIETFGNVMELVSRNMAIDITIDDKEKKEISSNVKVHETKPVLN